MTIMRICTIPPLQILTVVKVFNGRRCVNREKRLNKNVPEQNARVIDTQTLRVKFVAALVKRLGKAIWAGGYWLDSPK
jgi:hypothetical protein